MKTPVPYLPVKEPFESPVVQIIPVLSDAAFLTGSTEPLPIDPFDPF